MAAHPLGSALQGPGARVGGCSKCRGSHPVKVVEGSSELVHLLLADAFGISGQDLILHLIDGPGDGGEELLPAHTDVLGVHEGPVIKGHPPPPGPDPGRSWLLPSPNCQNGPSNQIQPSVQIYSITRTRTTHSLGQRTQMMSREVQAGPWPLPGTAETRPDSVGQVRKEGRFGRGKD